MLLVVLRIGKAGPRALLLPALTLQPEPIEERAVSSEPKIRQYNSIIYGETTHITHHR